MSFSHHDDPEKDSDLDSLPSSSTSDIYSEVDSDAQEEWERSLEQLQLLLTMLIVPWMGKYFGRKFAYWSPFPPFAQRQFPLAFLVVTDRGSCILTK